ncbi:MAG: DUF5916 domain-containing protein [Vicinamibacterales bacterium]|jgi:hypothetical protein|nr:hypothetical protein [Acidobacteriota bacterium]MDP6373353.1 DUF5916 domain-containing protein [Vicinamibacterales bacterium]|tara:strand:+ start:1409 stop:3673 length:2265 start_codon:yes stop_codon:yes gene_type:complete
MTPAVNRAGPVVALLLATATPAWAQSGDAPGNRGPVPPAVVARDAEGRVTVRAVRVAEPIVADGRLDDPVYREVPPIDGFIQQLPDEGAPATEPTDLWILFDDRNVYLTARCWDSQPERIIANEMTRDSRNLWRNDGISVVFDTFHDRRNAISFLANPLGGLFDSLVTDENAVNTDWNTVWDARTSIFDQGWIIEMVIPFKSLRYQPGGAQTWGINVSRRVQWKNESSYLSPVPASLDRRGILQISAAATLVGIEPPTTSRNLELKPYGITGALAEQQDTPDPRNDFTGDAGFDVKYGLTRSLVADFTVNTDFAQVEADEQQVNLTRFSLFFPEKREFFLEGQGIFAFGDPGGTRRQNARPSDTPVIFFSRRIGLEDGEDVPIRAGGRVTGRAGPFSIGLLNIQTGDSETAEALSTNFSVIRLKRDLLRRSNIGLIYTRRSRLTDGDGVNQAYGADANFRFYENVNLSSYYARTDTPGFDEGDASFRGRFEYTGDRYGAELEHLTVDEQFNPEIGFVRRDDFRRNFAQLRFSPRPRSVRWLRRIIYQGSFDYITDTDGVLETREGKARFELELENNDKWHVEYTDAFEGLQEGFEIVDGIILPVGGYNFGDVRTEYELGPQRRISGRVSLLRGGFFGGARTEAAYQGRVVVTPQLAVEPRIAVNDVDLAEGPFTTTLVGARTSYTFSPRMFAAALVQYNSSNATLDTNIRFRWEYQPGSDLFVVYSSGRDTGLDGFPRLQNRSFVIKVTRLLRF